MNKKLSLKTIYEKITNILENNLDVFRGFTLENISINDNALELHSIYTNRYYTGVSKENNQDYKVNLIVPNKVIKAYYDAGGKKAKGIKYSVTIDSLKIEKFGNISIIVSFIKETGVSDRELLKRRLLKYIEAKNYNKREKKQIPKIVSSILALTSKSSEIDDDIYPSNIPKEKIKIIKCSTSKEINKNILENKEYDIVVLYRGGREDEAMNNIFSKEEVIDAIVSSKVPVCVALGHQIDIPIIYKVADKTYPTPSAFAKEISEHNKKANDELNLLLKEIANSLKIIKDKKINIIDQEYKEIEKNTDICLNNKITLIDNYTININNSLLLIKQQILNEIDKTFNNIEKLKEKLKHNKKLQETKELQKKFIITLVILFVIFISIILALVFN